MQPHNEPLQQQRASILGGFHAFGFNSRTVFFNVCMSLDCTLNGFDLVAFYDDKKLEKSLMNRLEAILEMLKNE